MKLTYQQRQQKTHAKWPVIARQITSTTTRAIAKYGIENCRSAYALTLDGSGAGYVAACFRVHYRTADAMINAGRELA